MANETGKGLLFEKAEFVGAAGRLLHWRLECDALSDEVIEEIAKISANRISTFCRAVGVPRGGQRIADAFNRYASSGSNIVLVCDDVWTTGGSMRRFAREQKLEHWIGFVIFNRAKKPGDVPPKDIWCMWNWGLMG